MCQQTQSSCFQDYGFVGCHSSRSNDLSVHARIESTGNVRLLWETSEQDDRNTHASIFEVKHGKKVEKSYHRFARANN